MLWPRFKAFFLDMSSEKKYRTLAIISCGLYIFYPFFHCGLYCPSVSKESGFSLAVNITDNLCTKKGNVGLKFAIYNQERVVMACVRYISCLKTPQPKSYLCVLTFCRWERALADPIPKRVRWWSQSPLSKFGTYKKERKKQYKDSAM